MSNQHTKYRLPTQKWISAIKKQQTKVIKMKSKSPFLNSVVKYMYSRHQYHRCFRRVVSISFHEKQKAVQAYSQLFHLESKS